MMKFLLLISLFFVNVIMSGCNSSEPLSQPTQPILPQVNVTCNELSFYLDPTLGEETACELVPESTNPSMPSYYVFIYPTHTELSIQNYPQTQTQFPPQIWVYPIQRFIELLPDIISPRLSEMQNYIASGTWTEGVRPFLPAILEKQSFITHEKGLSFNGGQGVRYITQYTEGPKPITNMNIIYTFQGLTNDGKYWVAVTLPISNPILPDEYDSLPSGYTQESLLLNYETYISDVKDSLQEQTIISFSPTIDILDSLVESITLNQ